MEITGDFKDKLTFKAVKGLQQPPGTNLYGFYVMEYIRWATSERRARDWNMKVRKQYIHNCILLPSIVLSFIQLIYRSPFLKMQDMRDQLLPEARIRALQEELSGIILREVLNPRGEHYTEDVERLM